MKEDSYSERATIIALVVQGPIILYLVWIAYNMFVYAWLGFIAIALFEVPLCLFLFSMGIEATRSKRTGLAVLAFLFSLPGIVFMLFIATMIVSMLSQ